MDEIRIRDRQPGDLQRCVDALAMVHHLDRYPANWPADPHRWLSAPDALHAWVAEHTSAAIVGHLALHPVTASAPTSPSPALPTAEVSRLFVVPTARRQAVATRLLQRGRQWAAEHGYDLTLEVADGEPSAATALYDRTGWRLTHTSTAGWAAPGGSPVTLRHYHLSQDEPDPA